MHSTVYDRVTYRVAYDMVPVLCKEAITATVYEKKNYFYFLAM